MKKLLLTAIFILFAATLYAKTGNITLGWDRNTDTDLEGYKLYRSDVSGDYSGITPVDIMGNPNKYTMQIEMEHAIPNYYVLTAFDTSGNESEYSNQVMHIVFIDDISPHSPQIFHIKNWIIIN